MCRIWLVNLQTCHPFLSTKRTETVRDLLNFNLTDLYTRVFWPELTSLCANRIIRVVSLVPVFAIISFLTVAFEDTSIYLTPLVSLYEAIAFTGFFMLLCEFINPDEAARNAYFVQNGIMSRFTVRCSSTLLLLIYYTKQIQRASIGVFQFPVVMIVNLAATDITQATGIYCKTSDKPQFAHIWVSALKFRREMQIH